MRAEFEAAEARQTALNPYLRSIRNLSNQVFHELLDGSPAVVEPLFNGGTHRISITCDNSGLKPDLRCVCRFRDLPARRPSVGRGGQ